MIPIAGIALENSGTDSSSGVVNSLTGASPGGPVNNGPFTALALVSYESSANAASAALTAPGNWRLFARKHKVEMSATVELWAGWNLPGGATSSLSYAVNFAVPTSAATLTVLLFRGTAQGDNWLSQAAWRFGAGSQYMRFETPDEPQGSGGSVAQCSFLHVHSLGALQRANCDLASTALIGSVRTTGVTSGLIGDSAQLQGHHEVSITAANTLAISVNLYTEQHFDSKEGTDPTPELTQEEEMRYKERISELERELESRSQHYAETESDLVSTNRIVSTERDNALSQLSQLQADATQQIATLQQELVNVRAELQQTLEALPAILQQSNEQYFQQRLSELLADPATFRALLTQHAQAAQDPRNLFSTLQAMNQLG